MAVSTDLLREQILIILDELIDRMGSDVTGTGCVSMDGIVVCSRFSADLNPERMGAVAAAMMGVTRQLARELKIGAIEEAILKAASGTFVVLPAGRNYLLTVHLQEGANIGMVRFAARDAATAVGLALQSESEMVTPT